MRAFCARPPGCFDKGMYRVTPKAIASYALCCFLKRVFFFKGGGGGGVGQLLKERVPMFQSLRPFLLDEASWLKRFFVGMVRYVCGVGFFPGVFCSSFIY